MTDMNKLGATLSRLTGPSVAYDNPSEWVCQEVKGPGRTGRIETCGKCVALSKQIVTLDGEKRETVDAGGSVTVCDTNGWVTHPQAPAKPSDSPRLHVPGVQEVRRR
jgi:hypothetical protein